MEGWLRRAGLCAIITSCCIGTEATAEPDARASVPTPSASLQLDDSFPEAVRRDLLVVARDVHAVVRRLFPADPPAGRRPIVLYHRPGGPMTDSTSDPGVYRIGVSVADRDYVRFAYQLGHELGHVYLDPRRTNGLLETLSVAVSLEVLDDLAWLWSTRAPYPHWRSYAPAFRQYRERVEHYHLARLPDEVRSAVGDGRWDDTALYLSERRDDQDRNPVDRDLNLLGAMALRQRAVSWDRYLGIGSFTDPSPAEDAAFRDDLEIDLSQLPELASDMLRIGRAPEAQIAAAATPSG